MFQDILILRQHPLFHSHCIIYLLIPTSNHNDFVLVSAHGMLYIFWFLHQTTTRVVALMVMEGCISFDSYIKPQLVQVLLSVLQVVYLLIPTSNHNLAAALDGLEVLYIFWFLHQTTTSYHHTFSDVSLYIFWFLHQTTTQMLCYLVNRSCISFDSYIKPQQYC